MTTSGFNIAGLKRVVARHWQHHAKCQHLNWSIFERDDEVWQIEVAPIFQEVLGGEHDGKKVWAGFEFDVTGFLAEPGVDVEDFGAVSYITESNPTPILAFRGQYEGQPFVMKMLLEPVPNSEPVEIVDTLKQEVRTIRESSDE